jgi:two-component system sensor histidine kinase and response regulator WspE
VLSVLLVEISGDPYAFPLARIDRVLRIEKEQIQSLENRQYFKLDGANIGLVQAQQVLDIELQSTATAELPVIVIGARTERYGLAVDRVLGERQVVVRPLDPRLGKVPNISAASLMDDGSPLLIVDVEDLVHSINRLLTGGVRVDRIASQASAKKEVRKRVLIVDDSLTVREVERKLLANRGYDVAVAVDGAEGWNTVRSGRFDLIISDIDMPRMNGIELVTRIRADARFKNIPIMIVSYKEREEDRLKGMEAGANYYLTKSSFHDESLLEAVVELIGEPQ